MIISESRTAALILYALSYMSCRKLFPAAELPVPQVRRLCFQIRVPDRKFAYDEDTFFLELKEAKFVYFSGGNDS